MTDSPIRIAIAGSGGRMGRQLIQAVHQAQGVVLGAAVSRPGSSLIGTDAGELAGIGALGITVSDSLEKVADDFDIQTLDMHAHNPRYPVTDGWPHLVDEYINELTTRYSEPVILVGHSLGGMLSVMP